MAWEDRTFYNDRLESCLDEIMDYLWERLMP